MTPRRRSALTLACALGTSLLLLGLMGWLRIAGPSADTDTLRFESPAWLYLLALLPLLGWAVAWSLTDLPLRQRLLGLGARSALMAALIAALASPVRTVDATKVSTVFLVDVSDSVTDRALVRATERVRAALAARGDHDAQLVTFAARPEAVPLPEAPGALTLPRHTGEQAGAATDLQAALQLAYGLFPPGHLRRAVLISDGVETRGHLLSEVDRANRFGVRLSVHPQRGGVPPEVALSELHTPPRLRVGQPFSVRAKLFSTNPTRARVRLYQGETLNGLDGVRDISLSAGENEVSFRSVAQVAGPVTYTLEVTPSEEDRFAQNNQVATTVVVPGKPNVLYVEGAEQRATYLARALQAGHFNVDVRSPRAIPSSLRELERYDFFVLSDVAADRVSAGQQDAIERYVRDVGGGFLMAGGESSFGLGGWQRTRVARLLPVTMDATRRQDQPSLALALVIDKSGSMINGQKMELAREAAAATAELLTPDSYISVVGFDAEPTRVVRMQTARNRLRILRDIGRLSARGGTAIFPALDMAFQDLLVTRARIKHVILLTDGQTQERGIVDLVQAMRAEAITVSTVGLGSDVNRGLLQQAASLGGGRAYFTQDPHNIPRIFMRETTTVSRSNIVEEYFRPRVESRADFLRGVPMASAPYLHGYVATSAKPAPAQVVLASDLGEPILARQRVGLGWSLAWTSDVKNRWAVDWVTWSGFSRFFAQLVREHMRQRIQRELPMRATVEDGLARVVVNAVDDDDAFVNGLSSVLRVRGPHRARGAQPAARGPVAAEHPLRQVGPGRYEARFPLPGYGAFALTAEHRRDRRKVAESRAELVRPYPEEYATVRPNETLLSQAAARTGGRIDPTPEQVFDPGSERIAAREALWPPLLLLALGLFILDLALRRVRIFDRLMKASS